ncbi:hypothetical protein [Staphylococcus xylosus]|uniref:hypothetical protein n=1 Tax=Staphylococcus xylosus TaxID=1288 RepID=UPI003CEC55E0
MADKIKGLELDISKGETQMQENKEPRCEDNNIKVTGWEIVHINRKLNLFNYLLIVLVLLEVIQLFL